jgi:hypothetical protein
MTPTIRISAVLLVLAALLGLTGTGYAWMAVYDGGNQDYGVKVLTGSDGSVYMVGETYLSVTNSEFVVRKYDPATGQDLWLVDKGHYNHSSGIDRPRSAVIYGDYLYVTGDTWNGSDWDYLTVRFRLSDGVVMSPPATYHHQRNDRAYGIVAGSDGVYVTGESEYRVLGIYYHKAVTRKYGLDLASVLWTHAHDFSTAWYCYAACIARDSSGNVYIGGCEQQGVLTPYKSDWLIYSLDTNGNERWDQTFDGSAVCENEYECIFDIAVNSTGVYVTGKLNKFCEGSSFGTARYTLSGSQEWLQYYQGGEESRANALVVTSGGDVWVTGSTEFRNACWIPVQAMLTVHYDVDGNLICAQNEYAATPYGRSVGFDVVLDGSGHGVVAGLTGGVSNSDDYSMMLYDPECRPLMNETYGSVAGADSAKAVAVNGSSVFVTGTKRDGANDDIVTIGCPIILMQDGDACLHESAPDSTDGTSPEMSVRSLSGAAGAEKLPLVFLDATGVSDAAPFVATLRVYYHRNSDGNPAGRALACHRLTRPWTEGTSSWTQLCSKYDGTATSSATVPSGPGAWVSFDVTRDVRDVVDGTVPNYGWMIRDDGPPSGGLFPRTYFRTREYDATHAPRLTIAYAPCAAGVGACCFPDGHCNLLTGEACSSPGGSYQGDAVTCAPDLCPLPLGACCHADGTCTVMPQYLCQVPDYWRGQGTPCTAKTCATDVVTTLVGEPVKLLASPNPFTGSTTIRWSGPGPRAASLTIVDPGGRRVRQLEVARDGSLMGVVRWDGRDDRGGAVPAGIYFVRLRGEGIRLTRPVVLLE